MKKYEYKWVRMKPTWTLDDNKKMDELIDRLNKLGQEGWMLVSGTETSYGVFVREIPEEEE